MAKVTPSRGGSDLNRYRELLSRLEESRNRNFNQKYKPGLVPGSMRRGPAAVPERPVLTPEVRDYIRNIGHTSPGEITTPESAMYDRLSKGNSLAGPTSPDWDSLKGAALVQARKEHQAKLAERSAKLHSVMKDF